MKRIKQYILSAVISIGLLQPTQNAIACSSDPPPERYYVTYFDAELSGDTTYRPCYIDAQWYNNEWEYYDKPLADKYRDNLIEWQKYTENKPALSDIAHIIYELDPALLNTQVLQAITNGKNVALPLGNNLFIRQLVQKKDIAAIKYLLFSRECEPHLQAADSWEPIPQDKAAMLALIEKGKNGYDESASEFLRIRYGFQVIRLAHYLGNYEQALALYDQLVQPVVNKAQTTLGKETLAQYWALALKAGALKHLKRNGESLYYFSQAFAANPKERSMLLLNCLANDADWQAALALAKTPQEKTNLFLLKSANSDALNFGELQKICEISPNSVQAEVVLLREINKIERQLLSPYLTQSLADTTDEDIEDVLLDKHRSSASFFSSISDFFKAIWEWFVGLLGNNNKSNLLSGSYPKTLQNKAYIKQLRDFVAQTAQAAQVRNPAIWHSAAAYLSYLYGDYGAVNPHLDQVKTTDKAIVQQADLVRGLASIAQNPISADAENDFYRALSGRKQPHDSYQNYSITARALATLAQTYIKQGNITKAALCFDKAQETGAANILLDCYATPEQLDELLALAEKSSKTPFENYLFKNTRLNRDVILDIQGTRLLRKGDYANALKKFEEIMPKYWAAPRNNNYADTYSDYYSNFETNFAESPLLHPEQQTTYNKLTFARKVVELQQKANANDKNAAQYYYQLGNGFYGSPFWAYNHKLWDGSLLYTIGYGDYIEYPLNIPGFIDPLVHSQQAFRNEYGKRDVAMQFYQKALELSNDPELSAKAAYLAQTCPLNPFASFHEADTLNQKYAHLLKEKYSHTAFMTELVKECATAKDFLRQ
jgi:hypothetical protein